MGGSTPRRRVDTGVYSPLRGSRFATRPAHQTPGRQRGLSRLRPSPPVPPLSTIPAAAAGDGRPDPIRMPCRRSQTTAENASTTHRPAPRPQGAEVYRKAALAALRVQVAEEEPEICLTFQSTRPRGARQGREGQRAEPEICYPAGRANQRFASQRRRSKRNPLAALCYKGRGTPRERSPQLKGRAS